MIENEIKKIRLKAQIDILGYLLDHLCNSELPGIGRTAIKRLINNLITEKEKLK